MPATATLDRVPITEDEPESTRRLQALLTAHGLGVISYVAPRYDPQTGAVVDYPVLFAGQVYYLKPHLVLATLYGFAASFGADVADKLAYAHGLRH